MTLPVQSTSSMYSIRLKMIPLGISLRRFPAKGNRTYGVLPLPYLSTGFLTLTADSVANARPGFAFSDAYNSHLTCASIMS